MRDSLSSVATFTASGEKDVITAITSAIKSSNSRKVMHLVGGSEKASLRKILKLCLRNTKTKHECCFCVQGIGGILRAVKNKCIKKYEGKKPADIAKS